MRVAIVDGFYDVSHRLWAQGWKKYSKHHIDIYALPPRHWKWQMMGGSISLAQMINDSDADYDLFVVSDMVHLPIMKSLLAPRYHEVAIALYFHENQITYPWSPTDEDVELKRDHHYGFANYVSALTADKVFFNSHYHRDSFLDALPGFLGMYPSSQLEKTIHEIKIKSSVLPIGLDLSQLQNLKNDLPIFLWNHRWEYDKNPKVFFDVLYRLKERGVEFKLIILGRSYQKSPSVFEEAKKQLENEIIHFGYAESRAAYITLLKQANILLVTGYQDFFGISVVEAIAAGCYPILPDRLAYPEHIPEGLRSSHIYKNETELMTLLDKVLDEKLYLKTNVVQSYVQRYDWKNLIEVYDEMIESN